MSDREEGEIVDDDFEDISDNSIIVPLYTGKFEPPKENLPAISLSSVSDSDAVKREGICRLRPTKKKSKCYRKRRCRHERSNVHNSDSDDYLELDHKLHKQLKAAVHVQSDVCHKNSLRSRLKVMNKLNNSFNDEAVEKSDIDLKPSTDEVDDELIQLRLEALRTAVFNKYEHRKKRKRDALQKDEFLKSSTNTNSCDTNKENTHFENESTTNKKPCLEHSMDEAIKIINNTPPDEDEDVLRALLLASMSKKITKVMDSTKSACQIDKRNHVKHSGDKTRNIVWPASVGTQIIVPFKNGIVQKNSLKTHPIQLKNVKPIIINVDDDSDSEDDFSHNLVENTKGKTNEIESTVERFLKEQRARIEAKTELPVSKMTLSNEIKPTVPHKHMETSEILEKSSVKLLPKVKQLEYHKLLEKLKYAKKNPKIRAANKFNSEEKSCNISKNITEIKLPGPKKTTTTNLERSPDVKNDARALHIALKEMQTQKNGRLQIEEKYVVLTPIIKKINEATTERKKYDQEIKRLLEELKEAKKKLHITHLNFSSHVKELIAQKKEIERGFGQTCLKGVMANQLKHIPKFTSTPKKDQQFLDLLELSSVNSAIPNTLIAEKSQIDENLQEVADNQISSGNPSDILGVDRVIPKYISPLDYIKRKDMFDPLAITCPYDIDGNCRDPDCSYKHYSKKKELK